MGQVGFAASSLDVPYSCLGGTFRYTDLDVASFIVVKDVYASVSIFGL